MTQIAGPQLLTEREAAELLGLTRSFMQARRVRGDGPKFVRISSRCIRYDIQDLKAWISDLRRDSTAE